MENIEEKKLSLSLKSFVSAMIIIVALMVAAYVMTFILPAGTYQRVTVDGYQKIYVDDANPYGIYSETTRDFPFWKFLLAPFLNLGSSGSITIIAIIIFLLIIGGVFEALTDRNIIHYFLQKVVKKFYKQRYVLLLLLPLIFMLLSSVAGCFEEIIPLVPIVVALCISMGWDCHIGLIFTIISCGAGYAAGIMNPFGTAVAQRVAGVVTFSGVWFRILTFVVLYIVIATFLLIYIKREEKKKGQTLAEDTSNFKEISEYNKAIKWLGIILGIGIAFIIASTLIPALQDFTLYFFALCFLIGGVVSCFVSGMKGKEFWKAFGNGVVSMLPASLMILFASSISYILTASNTIDTILYYLIGIATKLPKWSVILFVYLIVLLMELFIPSGSAKAFLLMPLIIPIGDVIGLSANLLVVAYIFGDGLANSFYPTNPGVLISLNLAGTNYPSYIKKTGILFLFLYAVTCLLLLFGLAVGYC